MATGSSTRFSAASLSLALLLAGPSAATPAATAGSGCTQEDMAALVLHLPTAAGVLEVEVAGVPAAGARRLTLSGLRRDPAVPPAELARAYLRRGDGIEWLQGTLTLDRVAPGTAVDGSYDFHRADGTPLRGRFAAGWSGTRANCG